MDNTHILYKITEYIKHLVKYVIRYLSTPYYINCTGNEFIAFKKSDVDQGKHNFPVIQKEPNLLRRYCFPYGFVIQRGDLF